MKHAANLQSLIVKADTLLKNEFDLKTFMKDHFYITAPNPFMVSISGSSEQNMHYHGPKQVLDASSLHCDDRLNIVMATADGLGESEDDPKDNENNASISAFCAEKFCTEVSTKNVPPTPQLLAEIASQSKKINKKSASDLPYDGRTAMATLTYNAYKQQATVLAVGDALTIVFDGKTGNVKYQQKARVCNQGGSIWAPEDLQLLSHHIPSIAHSAQANIQEYHWDLEEDDIVVQMTDGVWSEFQSQDEEHHLDKSSFIETKLSVSNIVEIEASLSSDKLCDFHAIDICMKIQTQAIINYHEKVRRFMAIHQNITDALESEKNLHKTMRDFVQELPPVTAELFKQLYIVQKHDAITYHDEMPVISFRNQYQRISFGDCSTISVIKIPGSHEHLLTKLLDNIDSLEEHQDVLKEFIALPTAVIAKLVEKFRNYRQIPSDKVLCTQAVNTAAYNSSELDSLLAFIGHYKRCQAVDPLESVEIIRRSTLDYIKSVAIPEERKFLSRFYQKSLKFNFMDNVRHFFKPASNKGLSMLEYKDELDRLNGMKRQ